MKISRKEYLEECKKHINKRSGCMNCKFYDSRWMTDDNLDTWCKVANALSYEEMRKWDEMKKGGKVSNEKYR